MKKIYLVLFVILSIFVFSCKDNLISDDLSSNQNSGAGQVKVFVKQSRLIGPDVSDVSWEVFLYKDNDLFSGKNENGYYLFSGLSDGTYNITVSGKIDDVEKFTGSAQVTIANGNSVSVNVPIVATKNPNAEIPSTGYATITMDMSEELLDILYSIGGDVILEACLLGIDDTNVNLYVSTYLTNVTNNDNQELDSIDIFDNQQITFAYTDYNHPSPIQTTYIPAGYYNLSFVGLEDFGYSIKLKDNLVEIGDGLTTNIVLTQNDYEIVRDYSTVLYVNENGASDYATGSSLSDPIAFSKITGDNYADLIYLLSDVEFSNEDGSLSPNIASFFGTISSFGSSLYTIKADNPSYTYTIRLGYEFPITLKNVKLSGSNKFSFYNLFVDETVILDCEMDNNSTVQLSKKSNLQIGKNFSGDLYLSLNEDWKLGDTVINFENGKPENSNFYIDSECGNSSGQNYSSMFYIDDSGKLAQYDASTQWVNFAWGDEKPYLITQTQAKNKTYTSIIDSTGNDLNGFNGISTYDENRTWYFIANGFDESGYTVSSLYKVSAPTGYTGSVTPEKICEVKLEETGQTSINVQDIYIYNGEIYLCNLSSYDTYNTYKVYVSNLNDIDFGWKYLHSTGDTVTALLVENDVIYIATTTSVYNSGVTHSEIWRYKWDSDLDYTTAVDTYNQDGKIIPVPYYQTSSDIFEGEIDGSTFRITDLYSSEDGSIYGLLANYIEKKGADSVGSEDKNKSFMRGSVFKLEQNTSRQNNTSDPIMNANHLGLRKSFPLTSGNLATAKQYFILPRKIVGILNKKLVIVDDGMVPDSNDCNVDRFALFDLFDLADEISETIDVAVPFSTNGVVTTSAPTTFYTKNYLFN